MQKSKLLSTNLIHDYKKFKMMNYHIQLPNGVEADYIMKESVEFSIIIPLIKDDTFVMVCQHRMGADKISVEFPMGTVNGKGPEETARTELREETGYSANSLTKVFEFYISPGWSNQKGTLFVARDLVAGEMDLEPYEFIEVMEVKICEVEGMITRGEIFDASTILSFYYYKSLFDPSNGSFG